MDNETQGKEREQDVERIGRKWEIKNGKSTQRTGTGLNREERNYERNE